MIADYSTRVGYDAEKPMVGPVVTRGLFLAWIAPSAFCGPRFLTDDSQPVAFRHYEFYFFSTLDRSPDGYGVAVPAFEFNIGAASNLQFAKKPSRPAGVVKTTAFALPSPVFLNE